MSKKTWNDFFSLLHREIMNEHTGSFKTRHNNHKHSFKHRKHSDDTVLSKYIWDLKKNWFLIQASRLCLKMTAIWRMRISSKHHFKRKVNFRKLEITNDRWASCTSLKRSQLTLVFCGSLYLFLLTHLLAWWIKFNWVETIKHDFSTLFTANGY